MTRASRPTILVLPPSPLYEEIMSAQAQAVLDSLGTVERNLTGRNLSSDEVASRLPGCTAVLTSWGAAPRFDAALLASAPDLRIIGHAGGSVKRFILPAVFDRDIAVTHAAIRIAESVGEWALTVTLMALRMAHTFNHGMHSGEDWQHRKERGQELYAKRVGIVGASMTGRVFIRLLEPFQADIRIYDPYLSSEAADTLGVQRVETLDELMAGCDIISNHTPTTEETNGMIGAAQLALIRDGALFVNTARAAAVDHGALVRELQTGRFAAALDVFPQEPLAADSPLRAMPNVVLSPHVAGATVESRLRVGQTIADEFARFFAGEALHYPVTRAHLAIMA